MLINKSILLLFLSSLFVACNVTDNTEYSIPETVFEKSNGEETGTYEQVIKWYQDLANKKEEVSIYTLDTTDANEPLHVVLWSKEKIDLSDLKYTSKTVLLINNGIHPGEPDGIEACQLLLKQFIENEREDLSNIVLAIVPIYNIGGAKNRNNHTRANQVGPKAYGFRGNAQNLDLNRDFIKQDSKNTVALLKMFQTIDPDLFIDTHVSNGADYEHVITCLTSQEQKLGGELSEFYETDLSTPLYAKMKQANFDMVPYVNVWGRNPLDGGIEQFYDSPRYSNGVATLFHTPAYTVETHMLKPYKERVEATLMFLKSISHLCNDKGKELQEKREQRKQETAKAMSLPINWELDKSIVDSVYYKGYEHETKTSLVHGEKRMWYNQDKKKSGYIPYYHQYKASSEKLKPQAYIIRSGYWKVANRLENFGLKLTRFDKDTLLIVTIYLINDYQTVKQPYEGRYPHYTTKVKAIQEEVKILKGDYLVKCGTEKDRILLETLEPEAVDSYFNWNFFDIILQRKEGFSPYVFEDIAAEMLQNNTDLARQFQKYCSENDLSSYQKLFWIYEHSEYAEWNYSKYPVYRLEFK